jgi:hypothetical protein
MTEVAETDPAVDATTVRFARRYRRPILIAVLISGLIGVLIVAAWWLSHPNLVSLDGVSESGPIQVGQEETFDTGLLALRGSNSAHEHAIRVTIQSVHPNIVSNTADATLQFRICQVDLNPHLVVGAQHGVNLNKFCRSVVPLHRQSVVLSPPYVTFITPRRPGVIEVHGFTVSYRKGVRRQTQLGGIDIKLTAHH